MLTKTQIREMLVINQRRNAIDTRKNSIEIRTRFDHRPDDMLIAGHATLCLTQTFRIHFDRIPLALDACAHDMHRMLYGEVKDRLSAIMLAIGRGEDRETVTRYIVETLEKIDG